MSEDKWYKTTGKGKIIKKKKNKNSVLVVKVHFHMMCSQVGMPILQCDMHSVYGELYCAAVVSTQTVAKLKYVTYKWVTVAVKWLWNEAILQ